VKVAILVPNYAEYSGDARVAQQQAKNLLNRGHTVSIFTLAASMKQNGATVFVVGMPKSLFWQRIYRLLFPLNLLLLFRWVPKLKNYDVVIAHLYPMTWIGSVAKRLYKVNYVFWFHGIEDPAVFPNFYERLYMHLHLAMTHFTIQNADRIVSVSHFAKKSLKQVTGLDSEVTYNQVDPTRFHKGIDGQKIRTKLNLGDSPVLLFVGRLAPQKGVHLLIQAFGIVKKRYPTAKLVLAGDPTFSYYLNELKSISDEAVVFAGHVSTEEIPYYYGMCDVYTTCSFWENHNLPVLEAQTCGKPIVAFNIEAFQEVASVSDLLVEKGNVEKFAEACITVLKRNRKDLA
jgi:glycosyltransferase involved in cell wall biosynthesis